MNAPLGKRQGHGANTWRRRRSVLIQGKDNGCEDSVVWILLTSVEALCGGGILGGGG